jgi:hypothetical protein
MWAYALYKTDRLRLETESIVRELMSKQVVST